jgi:hypothetical protein
MQKYLILCFTLLFFQNASAQEEVDTSSNKDCEYLKDLIWIKDSGYKIMKSHRFSNFRVLYPSFKTYKKYIDTSVAGDQSDITKYSVYNTLWNRLRIQYTKLMNKSTKAGIEWSKTALDSFYIDTGGIGANEYAYVHWIIKYNNKRRYHYSALFLKMNDKWFLMDELKFEGIVIEKKKKKKKK